MKTKLFYILFFVGLVTNAQNWSIVGNAQFSNNASSARLAFSPTGEPYIVYQDSDFVNRSRVVKFNGTNWEDLGTVSTASADSESIAFNPNDNSVWVAHALTSSRQVLLYRHNGTNWQTRTLQGNQSQNRYNQHLGLHFNDNLGSPTMSMYYHPLLSGASGIAQSGGGIPHFINSNSGGNDFLTRAYGRNNSVSVDKFGNILTNETNDDVFTSAFRLDGITATSFSSKIISQQSKHFAIIKDRWIAHTRDYGVSTDVLQFFIGRNITSSQPLGSPNAQGSLLSIDMDSKNNVYITYADTNDEVKVESYKNGSWSFMDTFPTISSNSTDFFSQIAVNTVNDDVYFLYKDNNKLTLLKFNKPPALTKYYVDKDATGNNSGDSWANAMTSLEEALDQADNNTVEIWLADGKYTASSGTNAYAINIDNLKIYGGFEGTETQLSERDILNNETILSGDTNNNDAEPASYIATSRTENNQHVVYVTANNVTLDGLTIADGFADGSDNNQLGAAIFIEETVVDFTLKNAHIKDNVCFGGGNVSYWPINNSTVTIENSKFNNNTARWGASVYLIATDNVNLTLNLYNNLFSHNKIRNRASNITGSTGDVWVRAFGNNSTVTSTIINSTFSNFSSFGTTANRIQASLVLSENNGFHTANVANCILYNSMALTQVYDISPAISGNLASSLTVSNSIGQENFSLVANKSNTNTNDPMFVAVANDNYQLSAGSPAIDAGDNSQVPASVSVDLSFNQRIFNTTVDIGAYEFGSSPLNTETILIATNFKVYPNPFENELNIKSDSSIKIVKISNSLGQLIQKTDANKINTSFLNRGVYFIEISFENGKIARKKLVKK